MSTADDPELNACIDRLWELDDVAFRAEVREWIGAVDVDPVTDEALRSDELLDRTYKATEWWLQKVTDDINRKTHQIRRQRRAATPEEARWSKNAAQFRARAKAARNLLVREYQDLLKRRRMADAEARKQEKQSKADRARQAQAARGQDRAGDTPTARAKTALAWRHADEYRQIVAELAAERRGRVTPRVEAQARNVLARRHQLELLRLKRGEQRDERSEQKTRRRAS